MNFRRGLIIGVILFVSGRNCPHRLHYLSKADNDSPDNPWKHSQADIDQAAFIENDLIENDLIENDLKEFSLVSKIVQKLISSEHNSQKKKGFSGILKLWHSACYLLDIRKTNI